MNVEDERFSLRAALAAMVILSAVASLGIIFGMNPFAISFNVSFVYLPTLVLIVATLVARRKSR